jgi:hypothetical protein
MKLFSLDLPMSADTLILRGGGVKSRKKSFPLGGLECLMLMVLLSF